MDLLALFRKPKLRPQYAPILRALTAAEVQLQKSRALGSCLEDGLDTPPLMEAYLACEAYLYLNAILLHKMRLHDQAPNVQREIDAQFEARYKYMYKRAIKDALPLRDLRIRQHLHLAEQDFGVLKSRLNIITCIVFFQVTNGKTIDEPTTSWLDEMPPEEIRKLKLQAMGSLGKLDETDDSVRSMRWLVDDLIWYGSNMFTSCVDNVFKNCADISLSSEPTIQKLVKDAFDRT